MQPFYEDYLNNLQELHNDIQTAIKDLPQTALDWTPPGEDFNSLSVLIVHLAGAERYWLGDVVAGVPSGRDRDAEFRVHGMSLDELTNRLESSLDYVRQVLNKLSLQDLESRRISPRNGREITVAWALDHNLKHTALHLGHIQITRQLWDLHAGD
jgi:uncharacterized damage-inducible protein DinB